MSEIRFELLDKEGNLLRENESVEQGSIKHTERQKIRRGGSIQINEPFFTLTDEYACSGDSANDEIDFQLDNIKVYNRALSAEEIAAHYEEDEQS
jgi:hypothetical protein